MSFNFEKELRDWIADTGTKPRNLNVSLGDATELIGLLDAAREALRAWLLAVDAGIDTDAPIPGDWSLVDALTLTRKVLDGAK